MNFVTTFNYYMHNSNNVRVLISHVINNYCVLFGSLMVFFGSQRSQIEYSTSFTGQMGGGGGGGGG